MGEPDGESAADARKKLSDLVFGAMAAHVVGLATRLRLADAIGDRERSADDLAAEYGLPPATVHRVLRALAALEVLTENSPGRFSLAPAGTLLRSDSADSVYALTRAFTDPVMLRAWERLDHSVETGRTAFDEVFGTDFFDHLKGEPELSALFNAAMSQATRRAAAVLPDAYDFGRFHTVMDIGGGDGTLLREILRRHSGLRGIVFDSEAGAAQAGDTFAAAGIADRCTVATGDFFESVPEGADLHVVKSVLHDWDDRRSAQILRHCRWALPDHGRLLAIEPVLPDVVDSTISSRIYLSDLNMLVNVGGLERTRDDFARLFHNAGFTLISAFPLPAGTGFWTLEAAPTT
ncbi:ArsR family transcriptional regulator [Nocardiopsis sediminis]|uniref:ArsR family transcriptional regulator n=1 Tax=Nocardiopsis sediminis TaxID=1778267 RepID=A0ABV8FK45_9ACTN